MSLEQLDKANDVINQIRKERDEKSSNIGEVFERELKQSPVKDRKPPENYQDTSFLYIRSYEGDNGTRPGQNVAYWRSPDVNVSPLSSLYSYTTELNVGTLYNVNCVVHNAGDLIVPSAKVEFYLVTPSLGMDTRYGKKLGVTSTWVNSYSSSEVNIQYLIEPSDAGHKCLFARVFSFSPLDIPIHDTLLNPRIDWRIGQKNLTIAAQGTQMQLNLLHMPQSIISINFMPINREAILTMKHPAITDFKVIEHRVSRMNRFKVGFFERQANATLRTERGITFFRSSGEGKFNLDRQKEIGGRMNKIYNEINLGRAKASEFKEEIKEYRQMNLENSMTLLSLRIPNLRLREGEMTGFDVVATNHINGEVLGGITLLVTG